MEQWLIETADTYGSLLYLVVCVWTFLEGETVVLITGALIQSGTVNLSVWLLVLFAFLGSFGGDQAYFYIGRRCGTPLLNRWPTMAKRVDFAFRMLRRHETLFILSFRFIYGIRNISPFVIGMSGIPRVKFLLLNLIAASVWANTFAWGGYYIGEALETYLGESKIFALVALIVVAASVATVNWWRQRRRVIAMRKAESAVSAAAHEQNAAHPPAS